eukprot:scaffold1410_cov386-Prasinococcus_capsulatus_cf.AAC.15
MQLKASATNGSDECGLIRLVPAQSSPPSAPRSEPPAAVAGWIARPWTQRHSEVLCLGLAAVATTGRSPRCPDRTASRHRQAHCIHRPWGSKSTTALLQARNQIQFECKWQACSASIIPNTIRVWLRRVVSLATCFVLLQQQRVVYERKGVGGDAPRVKRVEHTGKRNAKAESCQRRSHTRRHRSFWSLLHAQTFKRCMYWTTRCRWDAEFMQRVRVAMNTSTAY